MARIERARAYLVKQFGTDTKWAQLNGAIWRVIASNQDHVFHLSDLDAVAESVACKDDDTLAVLALFSRPSVQLLRMELRSEKNGQGEIEMTTFVNKLREWWKRKSISDKDWRQWASDIEVIWIPVAKRRRGGRTCLLRDK